MSPIKRLLRGLNRLIRRFAVARDGMAATEFAIIAPVMITMFFAVTELSDAFEASTKVTSVASTAADLIAQEKVVCDAEMTDTFSALNSIMFPYAANGLQIRITSVIDGGNNLTKVAWSDAQGMAPLTVNTNVTLPTGLVTSGGGGSVIMAEVAYNYSSVTGKWLTSVVPMTDVFYLRPRRVSQIPRTANSC